MPTTKELQRGQGLAVKRYSWAKQPNGNYTIFNVPVFGTYTDPERGKLTRADMPVVVQNFENGKLKGFYPRNHDGHHDNTTLNKPGMGFIDHLQARGDTFYADLVEIPPAMFQRYKAGDFPYRSAEYNDKKQTISSVAMLESQRPYFEFPVLLLEDEELGVAPEQIFSMGLRNQVLIFSGGEEMSILGFGAKAPTMKMAEEVKPDVKPGEQKPMAEGEVKPEVAAPAPDPMAAVCGKLDQLMAMLAQLLAHEQKEAEGMEALKSAQAPEAVSANPVAMQQNAMLVKMQAQLDQLTKGQTTDRQVDRLKQIAAKHPNVNFDAQVAVMKKFASDADRSNFLDSIEAMVATQPVHPMTQFAANFVVETSNNVLAKFAQESPSVQSVARRAYQDYEDTIKQANESAAKRFAAMWPNVGQWVEHWVGLEKVAPGSYDKE
jgi:hypothetical protein